jgi:hypothetical protein
VPSPSAFIGVLLFLATLLPQDKKLAVPDAAALKEAEKLVRETFKDDYAKKGPPARIALAKRLLQQGVETKDNDGASYVMLREAADLSALNGEASLALQAVSELAKRFQVNGMEMKSAMLATAAKSLRTVDEFAALGRTYLSLADEALAAEDYDAAERTASSGMQYAKKGKDLALHSRLDAKAKQAGELRSRLARVNKAMESLEKNPEDREAHQLLGHYLALIKGDWEEGLKHLALGSEEAFRTAAARDLSNPTQAADQIAVGDLWWDLAEKDKSATKSRLRSRAGGWYLRARDQSSGITRTRLDQRLEIAGMLPPTYPSVDLLKLVDVQKDYVQGRWQFIDGKLVSPPVFMARVEIPYAPPEEYDLTVVVECEGKQDSFNIGLVTPESRVLAVIDGWNPPMSILSQIQDQGADEACFKGKVIVPGKSNTIVASVRKNRLSISVNDKALIDWEADYKRVSLENVWGTPNSRVLFVGAYLSIFRITKISLAPVSGEGKRTR